VHGQISEHIDGRNLPGIFRNQTSPAGIFWRRDRGDRVRFGRGGSAVFSALAGVVQRTVQITVSLLIMPLLINALGKSSFGIWAAAASVTWMGGDSRSRRRRRPGHRSFPDAGERSNGARAAPCDNSALARRE